MSREAETAPTALELRAVGHEYRGRGGWVPALEGIDVRLPQGEHLVVVGPSGSGKSTLLRIVAGFHPPARGAVAVNGRPVTGPGPDRGVVFQQPTLFPWLSVRANVEFGLRMTGVGRKERRERAMRQLELVGLADTARMRTYELSGGMRQRVAIARALAPDPAIVLMDEPFGALDALTRERMQEELRALWRLSGKTLMFITHDVDEAVHLGTRIIVLSARPGRIVFDESSDLPRLERPRADQGFVSLRERVAAAVREAAGASR
ncbi:ABC transporter ATP-binding protein [Nocardiopsis ansamitocini]|uniref:ABC transporter ATP-binding protein n=1 Tax=Nocardiopsis ansamitocini TaxID=1670832 RepID=A0A9W6UFQ3_9ACTN|nr:ABC transporter ATP-binding protein [Nocardiopsis ansamitocini]GLU45691.1 ABC transporter ATP-binding protein [Nocardiopsis ansamitocini]